MQNKQPNVQQFINQSKFDNFIKKSQQNASELQDIVIQANQKSENTNVQQKIEENQNAPKSIKNLEQKKQQVIDKVNKMTIDQITFDLLKENKLALSQDEKEYKKRQQKLFLIRRGAAIEKQEYMNFKALKQLRKEQRLNQAKNNEILREDGMIGLKKSGKTFALNDRITYNDRDLVVKKVAPNFTEAMRKFSDHSGRKIKDEMADGVFMGKGRADVKNLAKRLRGLRKGSQMVRK